MMPVDSDIGAIGVKVNVARFSVFLPTYSFDVVREPSSMIPIVISNSSWSMKKSSSIEITYKGPLSQDFETMMLTGTVSSSLGGLIRLCTVIMKTSFW